MGRCWQLLYETRIPGPGPSSQAGLTPWKSPQSEGLWAEGRPGSQHLGVGGVSCPLPRRGLWGSVLSLSSCVCLLPPRRLPDQRDGRPGPAAVPHPPEHPDAPEGQTRGLQTGQQRPAPPPRHHGGRHAGCGLLTPTRPAGKRVGAGVPGPQKPPEWICSKNPPGIGQNSFQKDVVHLYNQKKRL